MTLNDSQQEQFVFCTKYKNHPKKDLEVCKACQIIDTCHIYQEYLQPGPWIKIKGNSAINYNIKRVSLEESIAICSRCKHYHGNTRCNAYSEKIPTEILLGYVSHTKPYKNDQGIQFEPMDGPGEYYQRIKDF